MKRGALRLVLMAVAMGATLVTASLPAATAASDATDPHTWKCDASTLGLGSDRVELAPVVATEREADGSPIRTRPSPSGAWVPVVMVHGWTARSTHPNTDDTTKTEGTFSHPIDLTANRLGSANVGRSLIGQLQGLPGAAVFTFDYHPSSGRWVTDDALGPALVRTVACLAKASGQAVIVVGHSMGGLIGRYAATDGAAGSAAIARLITLGTPNAGSMAAKLTSGAMDVASGADQRLMILRLFLAECGRVSTQDMDATSLCQWLPSAVRAFAGDAGRALQAGSPELAKLRGRVDPEGLVVNALAGSSLVEAPRLGWFGLRFLNEEINVGDLIVDHGSAIDRASTDYGIDCTYEILPIRGVTNAIELGLGLRTLNETGRLPWEAAASPCFHGQLPRSIELTNEVMGLVREDIEGRPGLMTAPRCAVDSVSASLDSGEVDPARARVVACDGSWAVLDAGGLGDSWSMWRWEGERWVRLFGFPTATCRDELLSQGASPAVLDVVQWGCTSSTAGTWPTDRSDAPPRVMIWLGASAAWPDAPNVEFPEWSACDLSGDWCLLGGSKEHTLLDTEQEISVVGRVAIDSSDPRGDLSKLGVAGPAIAEILGLS